MLDHRQALRRALDHQEAAPPQVTVGQGETAQLSFTNNREFTKIVLVCRAGTCTLPASPEGGETKASLAGLSAEQEAQLCGLGGARFKGNLAGTTNRPSTSADDPDVDPRLCAALLGRTHQVGSACRPLARRRWSTTIG